ncbi:MAG: beta-propeller fold lactonase family protein [Gammaproteobacteria bacterium]|nr:beta-propeller fold lactonase family protein [Gammaproteobacteria bacterium]
MNRKPWIAISATTMLALSSTTALAEKNSAGDDNVGAVYTMTNAPDDNQILIFNRGANGALTADGAVSTNGKGSGGGLDPLGSQRSLVLSHDQRWLFATNAGSNEISVLHVRPHGLELSGKAGSGGTLPVSVAVFHHLVYVLNAGTAPNITGFTLGPDGNLTPIADSTRSLGAGAFAQVGFDPRGEALVITDKANSKILVYTVDRRGLPATNPVVSSSNGTTPFGFTFDRHDHLLVVEAATNAVSSYDIQPNGTLQVISPSVANGQRAACWIASDGHRYAFTANPGTQTISSYRLDADTGELTLVSGAAGTGNKPLDLATTENGRFLYALDAGSLQIDAFRIEHDGSLTDLGPVVGNFSVFAQGMAVR